MYNNVLQLQFIQSVHQVKQ